uniref:Uncharacterized protein n=1 Tax=Cannabis sativa TaxID=3483 RepID=A0A803QDC2_CANSA
MADILREDPSFDDSNATTASFNKPPLNGSIEDMRWHYSKRPKEDDVHRHPENAEELKQFDRHNPSFALEPTNVRLDLATDGFNLFGNMSNSYSMWPVILVVYNLRL